MRNAIFNKLQELPVAFFNANKAGDLISRVNNDTDKLNSFFSQSLMQFIGSIVTMVGAGIFLLIINIKLGAAALIPAVIIFLFTRIVSPWIKQKNALKNILLFLIKTAVPIFFMPITFYVLENGKKL